MSEYKRHPASFRDPSGFVFEMDGLLYRQVNQLYRHDYDLLIRSGLYDKLTRQGLMITHQELDQDLTGSDQYYKTLIPRRLPAISWPYEWCFSQWKAAALLTLDLLRQGIGDGMILKDATPFNIQFEGYRPVLIDSLSFEKYDASKPWVAYRQFLECFLAPLVLASRRNVELLKTFQLYPEGIPLDLVSKMLSFTNKCRPGIFLHLVLPLIMSRSAKSAMQQRTPAFSQKKLLSIADSLYGIIGSLEPAGLRDRWNNYYEKDILSAGYTVAKQSTVGEWLMRLPDENVLDLGANTGLYSRMAATLGKQTIAIDADMACVEKIYVDSRQPGTSKILPLCVDVSYPSPAIGWNNQERSAFSSRIKPGTTLALALVHHLVIGRNLNFTQMAEFFSPFSSHLIIEYVPKDDPKVKLMLANRRDHFEDYDQLHFLKAFETLFEVLDQVALPDSGRTVFLMRRR